TFACSTASRRTHGRRRKSKPYPAAESPTRDPSVVSVELEDTAGYCLKAFSGLSTPRRDNIIVGGRCDRRRPRLHLPRTSLHSNPQRNSLALIRRSLSHARRCLR